MYMKNKTVTIQNLRSHSSVLIIDIVIILYVTSIDDMFRKISKNRKEFQRKSFVTLVAKDFSS